MASERERGREGERERGREGERERQGCLSIIYLDENMQMSSKYAL
jgi:hypothetical protein